MGDSSSEVANHLANIYHCSHASQSWPWRHATSPHRNLCFRVLPDQCCVKMTGEPLDPHASPNSGIMVQAPDPSNPRAIHTSHQQKKGKRLDVMKTERPTNGYEPRIGRFCLYNRLCGTVAANAANRLTSMFAYLLSSVVFILVAESPSRYLFSSRAAFLFSPSACPTRIT